MTALPWLSSRQYCSVPTLVDRHWEYCRGSARTWNNGFHVAADASAAASDTRFIKMPNPKDDPKSSEWRPYIFARDQWHCRICGDRFLYSEMVRKHIANEHNETMPPSMYEYFKEAVWTRKKVP